jgi:hypothetical protein
VNIRPYAAERLPMLKKIFMLKRLQGHLNVVLIYPVCLTCWLCTATQFDPVNGMCILVAQLLYNFGCHCCDFVLCYVEANSYDNLDNYYASNP